MTNLKYLKTKFPKAVSSAKILAAYLDRCNIYLPKNLTTKQFKTVITLIIEDFFDYKIDTDLMSDLFDKLSIIFQSFPDIKNAEIQNFLIDASELETDLRKNFGRVEKDLKRIHQFYKNNKS